MYCFRVLSSMSKMYKYIHWRALTSHSFLLFPTVVVVSFVEPVITTRENQSSASLCVIKTGRHNFDVAVSVEICSNQSSPVSMPGLRPATQGTYKSVILWLYIVALMSTIVVAQMKLL